MVVPVTSDSSFPRLLYNLASSVSQYVPFIHPEHQPKQLWSRDVHTLARRDIHDADHRAEFIIYSCLIPILVLLSGLFAGLTLGYMSLDETQLNVLSISGTP